ARIDDRPVVVAATDYTVAGGSNGLIGNEKHRRACEIAATRGIPLVLLLDGGGHRIHEGLDARDFAGGFDIQEMQTRLSGWVPMVAAILGPGYGQPTIAASLCDYVVAVRGIATAGMAPPALVRAATGESTDAEAVNGPDAQATYGTIDMAVDTEDEALDAIRWYLDLLPSNAEAELPLEVTALPRADAAAAIDDAVPANLRQGYDMAEVIAGIVDEDSEVELKAGFAPNLITMLARIEGRTIGIIANQPMHRAGMLDAAGADKAAHMVSLCNAFGIPVLVLIDLPGLAVGEEAERSGLARSSARLSIELGAATVPTFTVVARKGYGGGYVIMSGGRTFHPELVAAWPHAETAVMAVETAIELVFRRDVDAAPDPDARRAALAAGFRGQIDALRGAEGFGYDAIIRPSETRAWLAELLPVLPRHSSMQSLTPRRHPVAPL
ncbi:acyl-CoA carboxylase subunit beta, partial [Nocardioides sp. J9]|uniref:acyl-CoA carboxylase subunit beta n=1 Tax=Nocardioides sp. J9 TaxID=935844 RepID=UPI00119D1CF1